MLRFKTRSGEVFKTYTWRACGFAVKNLRRIGSIICGRLSPFFDRKYYYGSNLCLIQPTNHRFMPAIHTGFPVLLLTNLPLLEMGFSPLSTAPIITITRKFKKGL